MNTVRSAWRDALRRRDSVALLDLLDQLPPSVEREDARSMASPDQGDVTFLALVAMAQAMLKASQARLAHDIAGAVGDAVREFYGLSAQEPLLYVAERSAQIETGAAAALSPGEDVVAEAARWLSWLEAQGSRTNSCVLALTAAEARLDLGYPEGASAWLALADASPAASPAEDQRRKVVRWQLSTALKKATELPTTQEDQIAALAELLASQRDQLGIFDHLPELHAQALALLDALDEGLPKDTPDLSVADTELQALMAAFGMVPGSAQENQQGIDRLTTFLRDPIHGRDPQALGERIADAERLRADALALGLVAEQNTCDWSIAICQRRLGHHGAAVDTLRRLWGDLEAQRAAVLDPVSRAGVFAAFPHFFVVLADALYRSGRKDELL